MHNYLPTIRVLLVMIQLFAVAVSPSAALDVGKKKAQRIASINKIPLNRLTPGARERVQKVISRPTMFRRLPTQGMDCDQDMFLFLVRHPEVLVGIWEVMDITQVRMTRTGPYTLTATDGQGTTCLVELIYGDSKTHLFIAHGKYEGPMVAKPITGSGVFVLHSSYARNSSDRLTIGGQMDVFLQLDSLGADLVVRTLGPLIGKSADHNFVETAKFITQVSQASEVNPEGVERLGMKLPQVTEPVRERFIKTAQAVATRGDSGDAPALASKSELLQNSLPPAQQQRSDNDADTAEMQHSPPAQASFIVSQNPVKPTKYGMSLRR